MQAATVRLAIPAQPDQARVARLVVGTAARLAGIGDERIDDIRLAVSEAVAVAMGRHRTVGVEAEVVLTVSEDGNAFHVQVFDSVDLDPRSPVDPGAFDGEQIAAVLMAELADAMTWEQHPSGWCARLTWAGEPGRSSSARS